MTCRLVRAPSYTLATAADELGLSAGLTCARGVCSASPSRVPTFPASQADVDAGDLGLLKALVGEDGAFGLLRCSAAMA
ncbi:hypothetical protein ABLO01_08935, partial [Mycobacterium tuberculosis]